MNCSKFPQILKMLRNDRHITQEELAQQLHVSRPTIAGYESRNKQPDYDKLVQIANFFDVSIDYLITGKNPSSSKIFSQINYLSNKQLENDLIQNFRMLSYPSKLKVLEYEQMLENYEKNTKTTTNANSDL